MTTKEMAQAAIAGVGGFLPYDYAELFSEFPKAASALHPDRLILSSGVVPSQCVSQKVDLGVAPKPWDHSEGEYTLLPHTDDLAEAIASGRKEALRTLLDDVESKLPDGKVCVAVLKGDFFRETVEYAPRQLNAVHVYIDLTWGWFQLSNNDLQNLESV